MAANPGYATLRIGLRAPRVAVVFDGGSQWHFWARQALHACTKSWGGRGFLLVPHTNGQVRSKLLAAARVYDPDYVVSLERTLHAVEQIDPGSVPIRYDGELLVGEERDRYIEKNGDFPLSEGADEQARRQVAEFCSPYLRRDRGEDTEWDEDFTTLPVNADVSKLTKVADIPYIGGDPRLSAPAAWSGALGVAVAARCGAVELPTVGGEPELAEADLKQLVDWLLDPNLGRPPADLAWSADGTGGAGIPAFDDTSRGLTTISRGRRRPSVLVSVGDTADDFALAYAYNLLYGHGIWLPTTWWAPQAGRDLLADFALRHKVTRHVLRGEHVTLTTSSADHAAMEQILVSLRTPTVWADGDKEAMVEKYEQTITMGWPSWSVEGAWHLVVDGQFGQDVVVPVTRNDADDIEMVAPVPPPLITNPALVDSTALRWQVDAELIEAETPRGRGLDGHLLFAAGDDPYLTWMRSGRDGVAFESERFDFVSGGTPPAMRVARPRLCAPGPATWADLMAKQRGYRMRLSAAGRRVEVMRRLWGDRAVMAAQLAGPMLPVLRAFRSAKRKGDLNIGGLDAVVLPTGAGDATWECYLTFADITKIGTVDGDPKVDFRAEADGLLERGVLRRGLMLGCSRCGRVAFVVIDDLAQVNRCLRCAATDALTQARWKHPDDEPRWFYDLHPTVREHLTQDGDVPLLLSHHLQTRSRSYADVAEMELIDADSNPKAEVDLLAHADRELITAEAKRPGTLGDGTKLRRVVAKRAELAEQLRADQILLATASESWAPASVNALRETILQRPWRSMPAPQLRLVCGLGTRTVTDVRVDPSTGEMMPWA